MTNKELIEKLQKLPQDAEVWMYDPRNDKVVSADTAYADKEQNIIVIE